MLTGKIELRKWSKKYKKDLMKICNQANREYLADRLPFPYKESDADWWLDRIRKLEGKEGVFRAIFYNDECVGNITIEKKSDVFCKDGEIGYLLIDEVKGKGIMSQAVKEICEIAFDELDLSRISGSVFKPNTASIKVLKKNGFIKEGLLKKAVYKNEQFYDLELLGKYKNEKQQVTISKKELADRLHTTKLGSQRCKVNLQLSKEDVIKYCQEIILDNRSKIEQEGKNYYISLNDVCLTINSKSFTLITAHRK